MKETVITWTIANWITVFLMVVSMSLFLGFALKIFAKMRANKSEG